MVLLTLTHQTKKLNEMGIRYSSFSLVIYTIVSFKERYKNILNALFDELGITNVVCRSWKWNNQFTLFQ